MRPAEAARFWTAIRKDSARPNKLKSFAYEGIPGLRAGEIIFSSAITAICGANGTGKTALLRALWASLSWPDASTRLDVAARLAGSKCKLTIEAEEATAEVALDVNAGTATALEKPLEVAHINASTTASLAQIAACEESGLDEILAAYTPKEIDNAEREILSYVSRKSYDKILIYEIDEFGDEFPFVIVEENGIRYDSRTMSLGELSIFLIYWIVTRSSEGSILLIEEPETYISPTSQSSLMDFLARAVVRKRLTLILTTHSPSIIAPLTPDQRRFVFRSPTGSTLASADQHEKLQIQIGLVPRIDRLIAVEDRAARAFITFLLRKFDAALLARAEIINVGGESAITSLREKFPRAAKLIKLVGLYDADQRGQTAEDINSWPLTFLPGNSTIEHMFKEAAQADPGRLAKLIGCTIAQLEAVMSGLAGIDDHDWLEYFAQRMPLAYEMAIYFLGEQWLFVESNTTAALGCIRELNEKLGLAETADL